MIHGAGRPLRFIGLLGGGWVMLRVTLAMHGGASLVDAARGVLPLPVAAQALPFTILNPGSPPPPPPIMTVGQSTPSKPPQTEILQPPAPLPSPRGARPRQDEAPAGPPLPITGDPLSVARLPDVRPRKSGRISVSSWLIARPGGGAGAGTFAPQLGGSQAGVRIDYALTKAIAATARVTTPARGIGRELALGVAWRPAGVPLRVVVEQRIALDAGRGGPSIGVSGGVSALPLPANFRLEGYAQAGVIVRDGVERFADGSARATRMLSEGRGVDLDIGLGAWGGAQRDAARLDIGPSLGARVPIAGQRLRIALDWRQRIAGDAQPGSGPALSMGLDF